MAGAAALVQTRTALVNAAHDARAGWTRPASVAVLAVAIGAALPLLPLDVGLDRLASDLYLAGAAVGLGVVVGLGGMPSLGHGAFVAIGAFGTALLATKAGWPGEAALVLATLVSTLAGAAVGLVAARLRPPLVAVVTWLIAWLVAIGLAAFPAVSGGAQGITLDETSIVGLDLSSTVHYELAVGFAALALLVFALLARSPAGVMLAAARENRDAADTVGSPVARLRTGAFALGAAIAALAGGLGVYVAGVADAGAYGPLLSAKLFVAVVLGGAVAPAGGLIGVAIIVMLGRVVELGGLDSLQASRIDTLLVALTILGVLGTLDRGLLPTVADWRRERRRRGGGTTTTVRPRRPVYPLASMSIEARGLTKRYGPVTALMDVDLAVPAGMVHALIGPNGSGKTTALRILSGAVQPDAGTVVAGGGVLTSVGVEHRARQGIVGTLQATAVFPELTVLENALVGSGLRLRHAGVARAVLATPRARADARAARHAALAALETVGLGAEVDLRAGELPGAAQRRLMIAAALATRPSVLLLDEPTAGAGLAEVELLADVVRAVSSAGLTIVLVEHNLRLVRRVADRVTVLAAGRAIASGSIDEVAENEAVLHAYFGGSGS
jgi:branched-chain amino acid transport system permease protein